MMSFHDFGQDLIASLSNSSCIAATETPIVIVAHSMGGLVAKQAILLAKHDATYASIASRIRAIYFLATPHRGANDAELLKRLMDIGLLGKKNFVKELQPGSVALDGISESFRHVCAEMELWSFFETQTTSPRDRFIVPKESAVMQLPGERQQPLQADHRHVCKFKTTSDPNYKKVRNAFRTTIKGLEDEHREATLESRQLENGRKRAEMKQISMLLGVSRGPEEDLIMMTDKHHVGTCTWLSDSPQFQDWLERCDSEHTGSTNEDTWPPDRNPRCLWLNGPPGVGKSVAAAYAINYLKEGYHGCSFYLFKPNANIEQSLSEVFRSLAYQMAERDDGVRKTFLAIVDDDERLPFDNYNMIFKSLFVDRAFKVETSYRQYWVFDALDECSSKVLENLFQKLASISPEVDLQILMTSTPGGKVERAFGQQGLEFIPISVNTGHTLRDIELLIRGKYQDGSLSDELIAKIVKKSGGLFMWVALIMPKLMGTFGKKRRERLLESVPTEMTELYTRVAQRIAKDGNYELARTALRWIVCSKQNLTVAELKDAILQDIKERLDDTSKEQLEAMCGHLIFVDKADRLQFFHQTAATFLKLEDSKLKVDPHESHARIASVCLKYMSEVQFQSPRNQTSRQSVSAGSGDYPLSTYASTYFSDHLVACSAHADEPFMLLVIFLQKTTLSWIEYVAVTERSLHILIKTSANLKRYLSRREKLKSPMGEEFRFVKTWAIDLARIAAAFGTHLLECPSCIHDMIPPLCPRRSAIHSTFASPHINVRGTLETEWSDRISSFFYEDRPHAMASFGTNLAVALSSGPIHIYDNESLEYKRTCIHPGRAEHLSYGNKSAIMAAAGGKKVSYWSSQRHDEPEWAVSLTARVTAIAFDKDDTLLFVFTDQEEVLSFRLTDGKQLPGFTLYSSVSDSESEEEDLTGAMNRFGINVPEVVHVSHVHSLVALSYRNSPIYVWDLDTRKIISVIRKEGEEENFLCSHVCRMIMNPNIDIRLLVVSYQGAKGELTVLDPKTRQVKASREIWVQYAMAASPDGRTLAVGALRGSIHLFAFDTLHFLHKIEDLHDRVEQIIFAPSGLRFFDIRAEQCNVWEPSVLIRACRQEGDSSSNRHSEADRETTHDEPYVDFYDIKNTVASITPADNANYMFCGFSKGNVSLYETKTGTVVKDFPLHNDWSSITRLEWTTQQQQPRLISVSGMSDLRVTSFPKWTSRNYDHGKLVCNEPRKEVLQLLMSESKRQFLLVNEASDDLWDSLTGRLLSTIENKDATKQWVSHPTNTEWLILVQKGNVQLFSWATLAPLSETVPIDWEKGDDAFNFADINISTKWHTRQKQDFCFKLEPCKAGSHHRKTPTKILLLDTSSVTPNSTKAKITVIERQLMSAVKTTLGFQKSSLYFLDESGWVCSMNMKDLHAEHYSRHFFIPYTWRIGSELVLKIISKDSVAFGRRGVPIIFHGYLHFENKVKFGVICRLTERET